jgi:23S rRNA (cytidine1920-2'-O)/16S rRNA (cytidine1409-2'-O)-methyltransferase
VKPQFEAGREKVGKKGVVREAQTHREVLDAAVQYAVQNGFSVCGMDFSPIKGPEGNIEFLMYVQKSEEPAALDAALLDDVVQRAHSAL